MSNIRYEIYTKLHAEPVARMWSESRDGWPPGFFGASEFTAGSIEMEENSSGKLFTVLGIEGERVVGYCRTTPYGGEPDAAYVALINVVPDLHGKKIGKNLLLDAVRRTAEDGYYRIDLHTWPANLKAMPLYKKTGFFWVPDSMVYMQNYMPFLLGRSEFKDFLGENDWYDCFIRELEVEPDEQKTVTGREIFNYLFTIDDRHFKAEFDRRGRILSSIETPGLFASIKREGTKFFFGTPVRIRVEGSSLPDELAIESHGHLSAQSVISRGKAAEGFDVIPETVKVPIPDRDRSPRISTVLPGAKSPLEIGVGIKAEAPVSIISTPVRRIAPGQKELSLDIRKLTGPDSLRLEATLDGDVFLNESYTLGNCVFSEIRIPLPALPGGVNELGLRVYLGTFTGEEEKIVLASGSFTGFPATSLARKTAVITGKDISLSVSRRGAFGVLRTPGETDSEKTVAFIGISAGPPFWNSDLPHQLYDLTTNKNEITAVTNWSSRPGLRHELKYRLDPAGFAEVSSCIYNDSAADQKVQFAAIWRRGFPFVTGTRIIPLKNGIFACREIINQVPDVSEDYPREISDLGAPWLAVSNDTKSLMAWFPAWDKLQYGRPETLELVVPSGNRIQSPPFRVLLSGGDLKELLGDARILGWDTGSYVDKKGFIDTNIEPVMAEGFELTLSHNLIGKRTGTVTENGSLSAEGSICRGNTIGAEIKETGQAVISLGIAGRETIYPVRIVRRDASPVELCEENGILSISNDRMKALIDPKKYGYVYSLRLDGTEQLMSSHPEPSEFAWEKPWYGGIHPRIMGQRNNPFKLETIECLWKKFETVSGGLPEKGWEVNWAVDHKKYGSLDLSWIVSMLPEVPLLKTRFRIKAMHGAYSEGEFDVRGFLSPGGNHENAILKAQSKPLLKQGREHAGAWLNIGTWGRVETPGRGFIEMHSLSDGTLLAEDYAESGCHLSMFNTLDRERSMDMTWIFGNCDDDEALSKTCRAHLVDNSE